MNVIVAVVWLAMAEGIWEVDGWMIDGWSRAAHVMKLRRYVKNFPESAATGDKRQEATQSQRAEGAPGGTSDGHHA